MEGLPFDGEMVLLIALEGVVNDRMLNVGHMDAYLVRTSCFQLAFYPGQVAVALQDVKMR